MPGSASVAFSRLLENAIAVVVSYVSRLIHTIIMTRSAFMEISLIVVLGFVIWVFIDSKLRRLFEVYWVTRQNPLWTAWLTRGLNFFLLLGIFLVAQICLAVLRSFWEDGDLSSTETIVFILGFMGAGFAAIINYQRIAAPPPKLPP